MVAAQDLDSLMSRARPLTRGDFETLAAAGAFDDERVELVRGVVLSMSSIDPPHADRVDLLAELLVQTLGTRARVRVQNSFAASEQIEVHREPTATGYRAVTIHRRGERVALLAFPDVEIAVDDVISRR